MSHQWQRSELRRSSGCAPAAKAMHVHSARRYRLPSKYTSSWRGAEMTLAASRVRRGGGGGGGGGASGGTPMASTRRAFRRGLAAEDLACKAHVNSPTHCFAEMC